MSEEETNKITLDLSKKQLKKVPKQEDAQNVRILILDENELQKIDNIDSYLKIETLSLSKNQLLRMYGVCRLHCLRELNLSFNGILSIEGLKECIHLRHLNLEGNNIKTIEHLNTNLKLEYLNLAENSIGNISDISFLKCLKELYLHGNRISHLRQCEKYLPTSLEVLTLSKNLIGDLNEISSLSHLSNLTGITISENPCVAMTGPDGFDYRPFVLNWCLSLKNIDGFVVDPIESLKAEWLYSQGRGRQFRLGEQSALAKYLSSVCPLTGKALENENERKLRLILSKAQHHQRQLQEEISENSNTSGNNSPSSGRKKPTSRIQSPRFSRLSGRQGSPESMVSSYHGNTSHDHVVNTNHLVQMSTSLIENIKNDTLMSQSFDGCGMSSSVTTTKTNSIESTPRNITPSPYNDSKEQLYNNAPVGGPLAAASKMVPVPETLMSPDVCPAVVAQRVTVTAINTQMQNSKFAKNKDNKMNSPKTRSPNLKRQQLGSHSSPRKQNHHITSLNRHNATNNAKSNNSMSSSTSLHGDNQSKSNLTTNSVHIAVPPPDDDNHNANSSEDDDDDSDRINIDKLKTIRNKAAQRCQQQKQQKENFEMHSKNLSEDTESCAVVIQKVWRGYRTRKKTKDIAEKLLKKRTKEYIEKLTKDMEMTKAQLENERKIQQLQMQAINALWKKVSTMQGAPPNAAGDASAENSISATCGPNTDASSNKTLSLDNSSTAVVTDLAKTCSMLTNQVQQLQGSMRDILNCLTLFCNLPQENIKKLLSSGVADALTGSSDSSSEQRDCAATQTEIVAVHTPQIENQGIFPFTKVRPSSLPLDAKKSGSGGGGGGSSELRQTKIVEQVEPTNDDADENATNEQVSLSESEDRQSSEIDNTENEKDVKNEKETATTSNDITNNE